VGCCVREKIVEVFYFKQKKLVCFSIGNMDSKKKCIFLQYTNMRDIFNSCVGFEWNAGNSNKNWMRHKVSRVECEQAFFNTPIIVGDDSKHSILEKRWYLLGKTDLEWLLFIVFTVRNNLIRVISARDMSKKERKIYYEKI